MNLFLKTVTAGLLVLTMTTTVQAEDTLRIGVEGAYKPFSWKEADGTLKGFDVEIASALCAELKRKCVLVEQGWEGMIPALLANKFDAIIASMSITEERKKRIDFSAKYYQTPARVVAANSSAIDGTAKGLAGKRLGVQRGTTHQCYAEKAFPDAELVLYATQEEVFQDLLLGRINAQISDSLVANDSFLKTDDGAKYSFKGSDHLDLECYGEGVGIAVRKEDTDLRDKLSAAILAIRENGNYAKINNTYFTVDIYGK